MTRRVTEAEKREVEVQRLEAQAQQRQVETKVREAEARYEADVEQRVMCSVPWSELTCDTYCCKLWSNDWARMRFFGPNRKSMNDLRSWFWARSHSLSITYTSSDTLLKVPYLMRYKTLVMHACCRPGRLSIHLLCALHPDVRSLKKPGIPAEHRTLSSETTMNRC